MVGPIGARGSPPTQRIPRQSQRIAPAAPRPSTSVAASTPSAPQPASQLPPLMRLLGDVEAQRARVDGALARARRGETFSPAQLLALQMQVYRFAENLEVISRVVDKTVSAAKTVLNQQV